MDSRLVHICQKHVLFPISSSTMRHRYQPNTSPSQEKANVTRSADALPDSASAQLTSRGVTKEMERWKDAMHLYFGFPWFVYGSGPVKREWVFDRSPKHTEIMSFLCRETKAFSLLYKTLHLLQFACTDKLPIFSRIALSNPSFSRLHTVLIKGRDCE